MSERLLAVAACLLLVGSCSAQEVTKPPTHQASAANDSKPVEDGLLERARKRNGGKEPSVLDVWNEMMRGAEEKAGAIKNVGKPRVVAKGAKPEITIGFDGAITFDGKPLRLGEPIDKWRRTLPGGAVCRESVVWIERPQSKSTTCYWDEYGIFVSASYRNPGAVAQMRVHLNFEVGDPWSEPKPLEGEAKSRPDTTFRGYLEIDGYGVDRETKFWEMRAGVDARRSLRCGLTDCSHPHGGGDGNVVSVRVDGKSEYDKVREITFALPMSAAN